MLSAIVFVVSQAGKLPLSFEHAGDLTFAGLLRELLLGLGEEVLVGDLGIGFLQLA
jgi:hypothetical protein